MSDCWIGLGANLGNGRAAFDDAWTLLRDHPQIAVRQRSGLYRTAPVGHAAGGEFLNAVCGISTALASLELLDVLQSLESTLGRTREIQWGPRTLDLDLLFVDQQIICEPRLTVPHPAAWYRRFVVDPLFEIVPTLRHPALNLTIAELRQRLQQRPLSIAFGAPWASLVEQLQSEVAFQFPNARLVSLCDRPTEPVVSEPVVHMRICLDNSEPLGPSWHGAIVADLRAAPGDPARRVIDFLTAVFDEPERIGDW
ncbi:MAG: 2-amino-4-hydroxy-6-hydroxymethyldihydropteridine diphosphokinase [Planctomycetota bacterium]